MLEKAQVKKYCSNIVDGESEDIRYYKMKSAPNVSQKKVFAQNQILPLLNAVSPKSDFFEKGKDV